MSSNSNAPQWRFSTIFLGALALAVGWGIRGNFGHEYGAGYAGCLSVIAVCLLSGRPDWRRRVVYFAAFGALGWGFGGSISYMQVIAYTHSGHFATQIYGFLGLYFIGFLWAAMGTAGAGFAAVADRDRLTEIFKPLLFIFGVWLFFPWMEAFFENALATAASAAADQTWNRHKSPLYWMDADYHKALTALLGLALFDLWDRRSKDSIFLPVFAAAGALGGWLFQKGLQVAGLEQGFASALTYPLGDPHAINPDTGQAFSAENLLNNWPQWFGDFPDHIGWVLGLFFGIVLYFVFFGRFRSSASLFVYMACGWLISFLVFPVFLGLLFTDYGGLRLTPPRSDDWSGILGVFVGMSIWTYRNGLKPVTLASVVGGFIGGAGFSGIAWLKLMMVAPGNSHIYQSMAEDGALSTDAAQAIITKWSHWQGQNWHSFLEQSYGFVNGLAVVVALGLLASRVKIHEDEKPTRRWTEAAAAFIVLIVMTYVNIVKNLDVWVSQLNPANWQRKITLPNGDTETAQALWDVPFIGRLPGVEWMHLTPTGWFNLTYFLIAAAFIYLCHRHLKNRIPVLPSTPLGKGQLLFLMVLWTWVVANWERAMPGMDGSRLLTEWTIFVNAIICTVMVLVCPKESDAPSVNEVEEFAPLYRRAWIVGLVGMAISVTLFFSITRAVYGDYFAGHAGEQRRFGEQAEWRIHPILKNRLHR
ncbi:MAG: hypothetical protein KC944_10870 [Candidatus Omnitrophica bacterium]|nr:hypothetical protein [Candidatus Omnitrophota bacterium]